MGFSLDEEFREKMGIWKCELPKVRVLCYL